MSKSIIHIALTCILTVLWGMASSQVDSTWTRVYGGNRDFEGNDVISTPDSGYLIIGSTSGFGFDNSQMYFLKLDSLGEIEWSKSHGGHNQETGNSIIQTRDGGFLGVGHTNSWGNGGFDLFLVKLTPQGDLQYEKYFGGTDWDFANDVIETDSNVFVIAGETQSFGAGGKDAWIVRYDAKSDNFDWNKTFGGIGTDYFNAISSANGNGFIAVGGGQNPHRNDEDVFIVRFNQLGDTLWQKHFGDSLTDHGNDIIQRKNSDFVMAGLYSRPEYREIYLLQIDTLGNEVETNIWGHNSDRIGYQLAEIDSNRIGLSGVIEFGNGNFDLIYGYTQKTSLHYSNAYTYGSSDLEVGGKFTFDIDSTLLVVGNTYGYGGNFKQILTIKTEKNGSVNHQSFYALNDTSNILSTPSLSHQTNQPVKFTIIPDGLLFTSRVNNSSYKIFSLNGTLIQEGKISADNTINLSLEQKGNLYIFQINTKSQVYKKLFRY